MYSRPRTSSFAQRASHAASQTRSKSGGGGIGIRWHNRWKPPQNQTTKFRFLRGDYPDFMGVTNEYYTYVEHFAARAKRSFVCSKKFSIVDGELTPIEGNCLGCDEIDKKAEDISFRQLFAFNGIHLEYFHEIPAVDDKGRPRLYQRGRRKGEKIMNKELCEGRRCKMCRDEIPRTFGKKVHWSVGSGYLEQLSGISVEIQKECICGGKLRPASYDCPECQEIMIDVDNTNLSDQDIAKAAKRPQKCKNCGKQNFMIEQFDCDKCQDPEALSIFDCDLEIKVQGVSPQLSIQVPRFTPTELSEDLAELAKPYVFSRVFAPDSFEIQAKILKISNPYGDTPADKETHAEEYEEEADFDN